MIPGKGIVNIVQSFSIELCIYEIRSFVRYAELSNPTNEAELKLHFEL